MLHRPFVTEEGFAAARATLRDPAATRAQIIDACAVLDWSHDPDDILTLREMRAALWSTPASELQPEARALANRLATPAAADRRACSICDSTTAELRAIPGRAPHDPVCAPCCARYLAELTFGTLTLLQGASA